jgi:hypothetical protein
LCVTGINKWRRSKCTATIIAPQNHVKSSRENCEAAMRGRDGRSSGNGRRGRLLTLAPVTRRALQPSATTAESGKEESDDDDERRCAEGRAALSQAVAMATAACQRPKPVHGVKIVGVIPSKFWAGLSLEIRRFPRTTMMVLVSRRRRSSSTKRSTRTSLLTSYP